MKANAPSRTVIEIGAGDFVKIGQKWKKVVANTAEGSKSIPKEWTVRTENGGTYSMWNINRYAKSEDMFLKQEDEVG